MAMQTIQLPSEREDTRAVFSISQRNNTLWSANSTLVESTSFIQILESILVIYRYYVFVAVIDCIILRVFKGSSEIWNLLRTLRLNNNLLLIFFYTKRQPYFINVLKLILQNKQCFKIIKFVIQNGSWLYTTSCVKRIGDAGK